MDGKPSRSRSPPPRPRRSRPPSFGAAQSFGINEKSLRKGCGGLCSPPTPAPPPPRLISPRCCRFSPFPARPRPDAPSPGGKEGGRGGRRGGGQLRTGPPTLSFSLNSSGADSAERGKFFIGGGNLKKKIKNYIPQKGKEKKPGAAGKGPDLAAKIVLKLKKKIRQGSRSGRAAGEGGERRDFKQRKRSMRKGPEFFPGWIPARRATNPGATALGAAGKSGKGKTDPKTPKKPEDGRGGTDGGRCGAAPARGPARDTRRRRGTARSPGAGARKGTGGAGGFGPGAAPPRSVFPHIPL